MQSLTETDKINSGYEIPRGFYPRHQQNSSEFIGPLQQGVEVYSIHGKRHVPHQSVLSTPGNSVMKNKCISCEENQ